MRNQVSIDSWHVGDLPFWWKTHAAPMNPHGLPSRLPFELTVDQATGTFRQVYSAEIDEALTKAYSDGSVLAGVFHEDGIGRAYADSFLAFLASAFPEGLNGLQALDIGAGTGYLMSRVKSLGANVQGVEPGDHGQEGARRYGVPIKQCFFPTSEISGKFDLLIVASVLEHISAPQKFLEDLKAQARPGCRVILSVPDCEPYISHGDLSMLYHEHWSYYTPSSLQSAIALAGGSRIRVERSGFGGSLYAHFVFDSGAEATPPASVATDLSLRHFRMLVEKQLSNFEAMMSGSTSLGVYVPCRAINLLSLAKVDISRIRFFDDDGKLHGTYYPGFDSAIQSRSDLLADPPHRLLIFSKTFGEKIKRELTKSLNTAVEIYTWDDLFSDGAPTEERDR